MSDSFLQNGAPSAPPASAPPGPGIRLDASGRPWYCGPDGTWIGSNHFPNPHPPQASHSDGPAPFATQTYNFPPGFNSTSAGPSYQPAIDPSLTIPPPDEDDFDSSEPDAPEAIAKAKLKAARKVAGVRQKGKGKKRQYSSDSDDNSEPETKRGRRKGSQNWVKDETKRLLDLTEKHRPLAQEGWKLVTHDLGKWSKKAGRPKRDIKSVQAKFKALANTKKPTGDARCPPEVKRAIYIEGLINERVETREISDDSDGGDASDDSVEVLARPSVHTAVAQRAPTPPRRRNPRVNAPELVTKLSQAFDPAVIQSRDEERSARSFQTTQFLTLSQQLRDAQAANDNLRNELATAHRARDRAELKLELQGPGPFGGFTGSGSRSRARYIADEYPDLVRDGGKIRCEKIYPDGGRCTQWFTDSEDEKENWDPSSSSSGRLSSPFDLTASSSSSWPAPSQPTASGADNKRASNAGSSTAGAVPSGAGPSDDST
ncbi:hypothetical protein DFH06DRAFT_1119060 [Mycena polygramma]|nr:hypothetical protein DFH06DRAFT_1119060 [Mycena polygramma]